MRRFNMMELLDKKEMKIRIILFILFTVVIGNLFLITSPSHAITINGSDTIGAGSSSQYTASGCDGTVIWSVSGTGTKINTSGLFTANWSACGTAEITATCCNDGALATKKVRETNNGWWVLYDSCPQEVQEGGQIECVDECAYYFDDEAWVELRSYTHSGLDCKGNESTCSNECSSIGVSTNCWDDIMCNYGSSLHNPNGSACAECPGGWQFSKYCKTITWWKYRLQCSCANGQTQSCYTGPAGTEGVGIYKAGTQTCTNRKWGGCEGEVVPQTGCCEDEDRDGYYAITAYCSQGNDCNDNDLTINPGASEVCDGMDNNCNGEIDEELSTDADGDGHYTSDSCKTPNDDCNDGDAEIYPSAEEKCDGKDNDCDGEIDEEACDCSLEVNIDSSANVASGNLYHSQTLFTIPNSKILGNFTLSYNSLDGYSGPLGIGWTHTYNINLKENNDGSFTVMEGDGKRGVLYQNGSSYTPKTSSYPILTKNTDGTYTLTHKDNTVYNFNSSASGGGKITAITDRNSNTLTFSYDTTNSLTTITDPLNRAITLSYDSNNRISTITDPNGNIHSFTYTNDTLTNISTMSYELITKSWSFTYDSNAFMLTKTDPMGYTITYTYDSEHRVSEALDPEGKTKLITYPSQSTNTTKATTVTEKDGGIWTYKYNISIGVLNEKTDPEGNITNYTYDDSKNLISTTEPDGSVTSYTYDSERNMTSITDAEGNTTNYTYNTFGQVTGITDAEGKVTTYEYDEKGNLTSATDFSGATTQYQYDTKGNVTSITNAESQTTTLTYDSNNNLTAITDSTGSTTTFAYDSVGNMTSQTDALGNVTKYEYNSSNQLTKIIDPKGNTTTFAYDSNGKRTSQIDGNGNVTCYEYNYKGQITKVTDSLGNITQYTYGGSGCSSCGSGGGDNLTSITDAKEQTTTYGYDSLGRLKSETDPLGNAIIYAYDSSGNLTSKTDANGNTIYYKYDSLNRLTKKTYPDGNVEEYEYNSKGNITYAGNQNIAYSFTYDSNSRVKEVTDSDGLTITYQYDAMGNRTKMVTPEGKTITYTYDSGNRISEISSDAGSFSFTYDSLGRRTKLTYPNGAYTTYSYDSAGRLTNITHKTSSSGSTIDSFEYTHDGIGNRLTKTQPDTKYSYNYDSIYRLLDSTPTKLKGKDKEQENKTENFSYDSVGNRQTGPDSNDYYYYNQGNQLTSDRKHQYQYDSNGNLISKTETDDDGKVKTWAYSYDYENRLTEVVKQEENETVTVSFGYDPFSRRIWKSIEEQKGEEIETKTYNYVYDNEDIILEYLTKSDGKVETTRYIHGLGIDEPLAVEQKNQIYYYHADGLGSISSLTNGSGKVVQSYGYDSFGGMKQSGNKVKQPYTFTGREWDEEIKLYYNRARYRDPNTGIFITKDPILHPANGPPSCGRIGTASTPLFESLLENPQTLNPYVYVENNPIRYTDPTGENIYGNWCGPGGSGSVKNGVDQCCKNHDECYDKGGATAANNITGIGKRQCVKNCDKKLCNCLKSYKPNNSDEEYGRTMVMLWFKCY